MKSFNVIKATIIVNSIYILIQAFWIYIHLGKIKYTLDNLFEWVGMYAGFIFISYLVIAKINTHITEKMEEADEQSEDHSFDK